MRRSIFESEKLNVEKHNALYAAGESTYWLKLNAFSDLTNEEWRTSFLMSQKYVDQSAQSRKQNDDAAASTSKWRFEHTEVTDGTSIDWRDHGVVGAVQNQGSCGSCWAFGAVESLGDRFAIATNASSPVLSPEDLVSCDELSLGCLGGFISMAWRYIESVGVVTERCFPYAAGEGNAPPCPPKGQCVSKSAEYKKYRTSDHYRLDTVEDIQKAIMTGGPVEGGFEVHQSFMHYKSGVYSREWWKFWDPELGGHAIKIIGWGNQNGTDYWLVANSWGTDWGLDGYFKIKKGVNECDIESSVYAGDPLLA